MNSITDITRNDDPVKTFRKTKAIKSNQRRGKLQKKKKDLIICRKSRILWFLFWTKGVDPAKVLWSIDRHEFCKTQ